MKTMRRKALLVVAVILVAVSSLLGGYYQSRPVRSATTSEFQVSDEIKSGFDEAIEVVQDEYAGDIDLEQLGKASIQGMLHTLDPHSSFFTRAEFDQLQTEQQSRIYGIGVRISKRYDRVYILSATPGGPGHRVGLRYGDAIVAIDGQRVEDWHQDRVLQLVRGEKGAPLEITVDRPGSPAPVTVRLKRDEVKLPTVQGAFITSQPNTGYIGLTGGFAAKTEEELTTAINQLKTEGMKQLVLDLRGNPGGLLNQAIEVSKKFLAGGQKILEVRGRKDSGEGRVYDVPDNNLPETMPVVILINRQTASASEVVAGALQDHDRALIVGENSFGKGLVQSVTRLSYGAGLTLTTQRYYTPTGRLIQRDYANQSFYDYYLNRASHEMKPGPRGEALKTDGGREVFGGGGIKPDVEVKPLVTTNPVYSKIFYGAFDFVRQLVAGQIASLREYKVNEFQHMNRITAEELNRYPVDDHVLSAYRQYIAAKSQFNLTDEEAAAYRSYLVLQLRREIITAAYGPEAGDQVYLTADPQLKKAIELLPEARMLAENARKLALERQ